MNKEKIKKLIIQSLKFLFNHDGELIKKQVKEECINHKLACYLERFVNKIINNHIVYDVDLEYNKNYNEPKKIIDDHGHPRNIRPDIIIHKRGTNDYNLIVFEIKKDYTNQHDLYKIKNLLSADYNYSYGCLVSYLPDKKYFRVKLLSKKSPLEDDVFNINKY